MAELALLFDIDGTLTPPRRDLEPEMAGVLARLDRPFHVAAGSDRSLVEHQFLEPLYASGFRRDFEAFLSNGSAHFHCAFSRGYRIDPVSEFQIREHLGEHYAPLLRTLEQILSEEPYRLPEDQIIAGERIIDRGSMINLAPAGRPPGALSERDRRSRDQFVAFDAATDYRRRLRAELERRLAGVVRDKGLVILLGGQTSFDLLVRGQDKTNAVRALLAGGFERVVFFGDALHPGGNDSVIREYVEGWSGPGACPVQAIEVADPQDTIRHLEKHGWIAAEPIP